MRIVSDFLDRVAVRAMGGEAMLSPRLPSLFEPARPPSGDQQDQPPASLPQEVRSNANTMHPQEATPTPVSLRHVESTTPPAQAASHTVAALESLSSEQKKPSREGALSEDMPALEVATRPAAITMADRDESSGMFRHEAFVMRPPRDRESASAPAVPLSRKPQDFASSSDESIRDSETGVLLPHGGPVFATPPSMSVPRVPASRQPQAIDRHASSPEPVVHVSIGRLEVRAAPAPGTAAPKRQDAARPSSLDDYLRQRGGKPS